MFMCKKGTNKEKNSKLTIFRCEILISHIYSECGNHIRTQRERLNSFLKAKPQIMKSFRFVCKSSCDVNYLRSVCTNTEDLKRTLFKRFYVEG